MNSKNFSENLENRDILPNNEKILQKLHENFGDDVIGEISNLSEKTGIEALRKLNSILWKHFISSCFHPDEFPIGEYRPTSIINTLEISEKLGISPEINHLDSYSGGEMKGFTNIKLSAEKKKISKFGEEIATKNLSPKEYLSEFYRVYDEILAPLKGKPRANLSKDGIQFFDDFLKELWIFDELDAFAKENFKNDDVNKFKIFLLRDNFIETFDEIKKIFAKKLMNPKYASGNLSETDFYAEFQNAILTLVFEKFFPEYRAKLEKAELLDEKNGLKIAISYDDFASKNRYADAIKVLVSDNNFGEEFFEKYARQILKIKNGRPIEFFSIWKEKFTAWADENGNLRWYQNREKISFEEFFAKMTNISEKNNFSSTISLLLGVMAGQFHIGSERELRPVISDFMREYFTEKSLYNAETQQYIDRVMTGLGIFDTYDEKGDNSGKTLAGSAGAMLNDMLKMLIVGGNFAKNQMKKASEHHESNMAEVLKNFSHIGDRTLAKLRNPGVHSDDRGRYEGKFLDLGVKFKTEPNIENFLEFMKNCFEIDKNVKIKTA